MHKAMKVQLKSIICTSDLTDLSKNAVLYGIALAKEFSGRLYVCHVIDLSLANLYGAAIAYSKAQENRDMNYAHVGLKLVIGEEPVDWEPLITIGHTAKEIARLATEKRVDLAIVASRGRSGLKRVILGSVTESLMWALPCPLLVAPSTKDDFIAFHKEKIWPERILVGCDFSPYSNLAFQYALGLAQEFQSEIHLAHVIEQTIPKYKLMLARKKRERFQRVLCDQLQKKLESIVPKESHEWCGLKTTLLTGQLDKELTKYAVLNHMDLIVLGTGDQDSAKRLRVKSNTYRVIQRAQCLVLSVPHNSMVKSRIHSWYLEQP